MDWSSLGRVTATSVVTTTAVQTVTGVVALRRGRRDYADLAWGPGLAAIAVGGAVVGHGDPWRRWTLAALTGAWAARLARQMLSRVGGSDEEDSRYTEFLDGDGTALVVLKVFVTQGLSQLIVSAPLQVAAVTALPAAPRRWLFPLGAGVMVAGAVVEAVGDRQKAAYGELGDDKPDVLDTGLWAWSRHPNYLGDSVFWVGAWVASAASPPAGWTLPSPALMGYLLAFATGARRTERHMEDRPGYRDYQKRVPFFVPLPWKHA